MTTRIAKLDAMLLRSKNRIAELESASAVQSNGYQQEEEDDDDDDENGEEWSGVVGFVS